MGYASTGGAIVFTEEGKQKFLAFLISLARHEEVDVRPGGRKEASDVYMIFLKGTHVGSGSMLTHLRGMTNAKQLVHRYLVPPKVVREKASAVEAKLFKGGVLWEFRHLWEVPRKIGEKSALPSDALKEVIERNCFSDLECSTFENFAKHYRCEELLAGLHLMGWIDWEATGDEITMQGEDDEQWGYRAELQDDGRRILHSVLYSKDLNEEPVEYDEENAEHVQRGKCEECDYHCVSEDQTMTTHKMCPQCAWNDEGCEYVEDAIGGGCIDLKIINEDAELMLL
jgi:hypothetical protein